MNNNVSQNRYLYNGKELQDQVIGCTVFGWYDYGARFYDLELGRLNPLIEKFNNQSSFAYAVNNPARMTYFLGLGPKDEVKSSWKLNFSLTLTTRKIGLGGKVAGVGVEASSYPIAGASLSVDIYIRIENGCFNMGITHTDKQVLEESSSSFGPFHGTEGVGMETKKRFKCKKWSKKTEEKEFIEYESGGIGCETTEDNKDRTTIKLDLAKVEVNVFMIGTEMGTSFSHTSGTGDNS